MYNDLICIKLLLLLPSSSVLSQEVVLKRRTTLHHAICFKLTLLNFEVSFTISQQTTVRVNSCSPAQFLIYSCFNLWWAYLREDEHFHNFLVSWDRWLDIKKVEPAWEFTFLQQIWIWHFQTCMTKWI
jgi:hypothetical protein